MTAVPFLARPAAWRRPQFCRTPRQSSEILTLPGDPGLPQNDDGTIFGSSSSVETATILSDSSTKLGDPDFARSPRLRSVILDCPRMTMVPFLGSSSSVETATILSDSSTKLGDPDFARRSRLCSEILTLHGDPDFARNS